MSWEMSRVHELSITQNLLRFVLQKAEEAGAARVREIRICYGPYSGIEPECIRMYLSLLARGTIAEGAALSAVRIPLRARCRACGRESELTVTHLACPACGGTDLEVLSGREFYIDSLEVDPLGNQSSASGDGMEPAGR